MVQTYKKVLLLLLITCFTGINEGCHKKIFPLFHRKKIEQYSPSKQFNPYDIKKTEDTRKSNLSRIEKKKNREAERNERKDLKAQEKGRKDHINRQSPAVQERMKKSFEESEKLRKRKTIWERLMFWKNREHKEKKL